MENFKYELEHPLSKEVIDLLKSKGPLTYYDVKTISKDLLLSMTAKLMPKEVEL
jgi:hypothetical protein